MGSKSLVGPITVYIAAALSARRGEFGMSYDALAKASGLSKPVVVYGLKGTQSIAVEAYVMLCAALDVEAGPLLDEAERETRDPVEVTQADDLARAAWEKRSTPSHEGGGGFVGGA